SSTSTNHSQLAVTHPYARLFAKQSGKGIKRRRAWNHTFEKSIFTVHEIVTLDAPRRRSIYTATLEAHVDRLHTQMLDAGYYPIPFEKLEPFTGMNYKTSKSMVAGLQHDADHCKIRLLELLRA
ncbi:hypothetical protein BV25DRAFT_1778195, partial [Artomyces pyxidatus]